MDKKYLDLVGRFSPNDFDIRHVITKASDEITQYHYHDFYEIFILMDGMMDFILEGRTYHLTPGNILLIHFHDLHQAIPKGTGVYERFYLYIDPPFFEKSSTPQTDLSQCFNIVNKRRSRLLTTSLKDVKPFISRFLILKNQTKFGTDILLNNLLLEFLVFLNHCWQTQAEEVTLLTVSENPLIRKVIDFIVENLEQPLILEDLAQEFFVSKEHLAREFKKATGFTPHYYITARKLNYSKELLAEGKKAVDIYTQCGFSNYSHFNTTFKKMFKMTPNEFKKSLHQKNKFPT